MNYNLNYQNKTNFTNVKNGHKSFINQKTISKERPVFMDKNQQKLRLHYKIEFKTIDLFIWFKTTYHYR